VSSAILEGDDGPFPVGAVMVYLTKSLSPSGPEKG
jgi:hypothetical protein